MKHLWISILLIASAASQSAVAGLYTDDLSRCLVSSTTKEDRVVLVKWIFTALAQHPDVASLTTIDSANAESATKELGAMFMRLMTDVCGAKLVEAIKYEGTSALEQSFSVLGQVAARELMVHPDVLKSLTGLEKHLDRSKFEALKEKKADNQ
jgi:hypothetical protein